MLDSGRRSGNRPLAWLLTATLLGFAALPALHGAHDSEAAPPTAVSQQPDATFAEAETECPVCRWLARERIASGPAQGDLVAPPADLLFADLSAILVPREASGGTRARSPPA